MLITCRETGDRIAHYLIGGLSLEERLEVSRHVVGCAECRSSMAAAQDSLRSVRRRLRAAHDPRLEEVPATLIDAILALSATGVSTNGLSRQQRLYPFDGA